MRAELTGEDQLVVHLDPVEQQLFCLFFILFGGLRGQDRVELPGGKFCRFSLSPLVGHRGALFHERMGIGGQVLRGAEAVQGVSFLPGGQRRVRLKRVFEGGEAFDQGFVGGFEVFGDGGQAAGGDGLARNTHVTVHLGPEIAGDDDVARFAKADHHFVHLTHPRQGWRSFGIEGAAGCDFAELLFQTEGAAQHLHAIFGRELGQVERMEVHVFLAKRTLPQFEKCFVIKPLWRALNVVEKAEVRFSFAALR